MINETETTEIFQLDLAEILTHRRQRTEGIEVIHTYTRKEAIEDGGQVLVEGELATIARRTYKYPMYMTRGVFELIETAVNNKKCHNDWNGVFKDLMITSRFCVVAANETCRKFTCIITGTGRKKKHTFYLEVGAMDIDDPAPVMTLMQQIDR
jgi:hypothetical protein